MGRRGVSYQKRVTDVNRIYDQHAKSGLSNREIWRRFIYPFYAISERTFYNMLKVSEDKKIDLLKELDLQQKTDEDGKRDSNDSETHPEGHSG